jgi:hypothetical protein
MLELLDLIERHDYIDMVQGAGLFVVHMRDTPLSDNTSIS